MLEPDDGRQDKMNTMLEPDTGKWDKRNMMLEPDDGERVGPKEHNAGTRWWQVA